MYKGLHWILYRYRRRKYGIVIYKPAFAEQFPSEKCSQCNHSGSSSTIHKQGSPPEFCKDKVFWSRLLFLPESKKHLSAWNENKALLSLSPPSYIIIIFFSVCLLAGKKKHTLPPSPSSTLFCSFSSLTIIFFWEHTCCVFGGRLTVIFPPWKGHDSKSAPLENTMTLPSLSQPDAPGPARVCSHLLWEGFCSIGLWLLMFLSKGLIDCC